MGLFDKFKELTVNDGINLSRTQKDAVLIDVRPKEKFKSGHIAGAINVPGDRLELAKKRIPSQETTIYVVGDYQHSQKKAARELKKLGYKNAIPSGTMEEHFGVLKK